MTPSGRAFAALALAVALALLGAPFALADTPPPTAATVGDPRSSGQGPGLVGDPLTAILAVLALALLSLVLTAVYLRLTAGRGGASGRA